MKDNKVNYFEIFEKIDFQKIIDHPNILIAANFWDYDRFFAAKVCYRFMREIDDFIDNYKSLHTVITEEQKEIFTSRVNEWIGSVNRETSENTGPTELTSTFRKYRIPLWTMENFARSMIYDINNSGFSTLENFLEYSRGASVAPASVFVHLCGITETSEGYKDPSYDVRAAATPCAIFSYLVHIIRDFQKDQFNNLNYFADDILLKHGLKREHLRDIAYGGAVTPGFREVIKEYKDLAEIYKEKTYRMIREIKPYLEPRYQLSLEIIFNLYLIVYERINVKDGLFTAEELNPTAAEVRERVYSIIKGFREAEQTNPAYL